MKTRRKSADSKDFILDVAEKTLIEVGLSGLKISVIAERANMRHSNIIYHFGSIEDVRTELMKRLIGRHVSDIMNIVQEVGNKNSEEITAVPAIVIKRLFAMYSDPYLPALLGWRLSSSPGKPNQEIEMMVEGFIQITSTNLTELNLVEQAKRDNILTIVHMALSVCIGNMFLKSMWSDNITSQAIDASLEAWVTKTVTEMTGVENAKRDN